MANLLVGNRWAGGGQPREVRQVRQGAEASGVLFSDLLPPRRDTSAKHGSRPSHLSPATADQHAAA
jgi:hypothetical protein